MAWRCHGKDNNNLVDNLKNAGIITNPRVEKTMKVVDRKNYAISHAYDDAPQSIGYGATISAPHMHAYALEYLEPFLKPGNRALDIGSGSGYVAACMANMVGEKGKVVGIEHVKALNDMAYDNISNDHPEFLESNRITLQTGDGRLGQPSEGPYDCIHVGAAAENYPFELIDQLNSPGLMFIPIGSDYSQSIYLIEKDASGNVSNTKLMGVRYVPLTDIQKQWSFQSDDD